MIRVLLADDHTIVRQGVRLCLEAMGDIEVIAEAEDGQTAFQLATQLKPDVAVMDLSMPNLDGITATQRLRLLPRTRNVPVILLTGYPQKAIERGALEAGVDVFLTKPCLPEDLEVHVRRVMESKGRTT